VKVGILGSGDVARALGSGFHARGHEVVFGTRDPAKLDDWVAAHPGGRAEGFEEAAAHGELAVLAVRGSAAAEVLRRADAGRSLAGTTVIDATNPIADTPPVNGVLAYFTGPDDSLMERLQREFPETRFVKAFNSVGHQYMVDPVFEGGPPTMFVCGDDAGAKAEVTGILDALGWETEDMGPVEAARVIEPLCALRCLPGLLHGRWDHAFKLVRATS
jgi:predicted dinucleotide-binding enzyme